MNTVVIYLHGWGSSSEGDSARAFADFVENNLDAEFFAPDLDYSVDPDQLVEYFDQLAQGPADDVIFVGSSAGGFWADYIAAKYRIKTILINPSLRPSVNFQKYNLPESYYDKYKQLELDRLNVDLAPATVFVGDQDEVVPFWQISSVYSNPIVLYGEGHRLNNLAPVFDMLKSMIGNFPEIVPNEDFERIS